MQTVRDAIGPAEAMFVLNYADRGGMTTYEAQSRHEATTGEPKIIRLQRGPSALRF